MEASKGWPTSNRNPGRLRIGTGGRLPIGMHGRLRRDTQIFVSLELSRKVWLITSLSPGAGEKMSKHSVPAGDVSALGFRQVIASGCHQTRDRSGRWRLPKLLQACLLGLSMSGCPFADDTKRAPKSLRSQTSPKFRTVPAASAPLFFEEWQMMIERSLSRSEDIRPSPAHVLLWHQLATVTGFPDDFNRHPFSEKSEDRGVHLLAPQKPVILKLFRAGE